MKRVLLLLPNGFEALEAAAFSDVFGFASTFGSEEIDVITTGLHPKLACTFAFEVIPTIQLSEVKVTDFDALAIPGGFEKAGFFEDAYCPELLEIIRAFNEVKKPIAAICVGALPVAKSGVLNGRNATTYHLLEGKRRQELSDMGVNVLDTWLVKDGNIITSTAPATACDVAFALLEELTSTENVDKTRKQMGFA